MFAGLLFSNLKQMKFNVSAKIIYGLTGVAAQWLMTIIYLYVAQKNHNAPRAIHEVSFVMSDGLPCCSHTESKETVRRCMNPHCKAKLSHKIIEHINSANHLICVALYILTVPQISDAILNAVQRGVKVRMIADYLNTASTGSQINRLQENGVAMWIVGGGDRYMHHKFCLIDVLDNESGADENTHPTKGLLINGSMNWTANGFRRNWENVLFTSDDHLKSEYKKAFDYMWSRREEPSQSEPRN